MQGTALILYLINEHEVIDGDEYGFDVERFKVVK